VHELGKSGTYGVLFSAKLKHDNTPVILKQYVAYDEAEGIDDDIFKEILLLRHLNEFPETKTVKLYGVAFGDRTLYLVLEALTHDLRYLITEKIRLDLEERRVLLYRMLCALDAIHQLGIVHNDIKPANIMILKTADDSDGYDVRIIDFGLADFIGIGPSQRMSRHYISTEIYKAPDDRTTSVTHKSRNGTLDLKYHDGNRKSFVSDVYSIAVTIINVCFRYEFDVQYHDDRIYVDGKLDECLFANERFGVDGHDLLRKMLCNDSRTRITCAQALKHPYFCGLTPFLPQPRMVGSGSSSLSTQVDFGNLVRRHEKYTRDDYMGSVHELAYIEEMHANYEADVIPCVSKGANLDKMSKLVLWLLERLTEPSSTKCTDYPLVKYQCSDGIANDLFETLDVVLNGAALAAQVIESGFFKDSPQLIGIVSCRIYATIFEYIPAKVRALRRRCDESFTDENFHDCSMRIVQYFNGNFPIRPVWLHLQYLAIKLEYKPAHDEKGLVEVVGHDRLLEKAIGLICEYYMFVTKPPEDFTIWHVVQYSVKRALAELQSDVKVSLGPKFRTIHEHFKNCDRINDTAL
jgi:serine/threonine protein kinase